MQVSIMITDGGAHPPDLWATVTSNQILDLVQVDAGSASPAAVEARIAKEELRAKMLRFFTQEHAAVQIGERDACKKDVKRHRAVLDPSAHLDGCRDGICALFNGTPFAQHFAKPEVEAVVHRIVGQHFANVMHIERRYAAQKTGA